MKTELILVGKTNDKLYVSGINDYAERIAHYMPFGITTTPAIKNTKSLSEEQQKQMEGEQILKLLQPSDTVVLMDEHGAERTSMQMTFSHQMVRLIFTEQLYRACTIIKGESYHHE